MTRIATLAEVPDDLAQAWLQHLRDFDAAHPGCHFKVVSDTAPDLPLTELMRGLKVDPPLDLEMMARMRDLERLGIAKIVTDLAWRGPNGKRQNFVCLPREMAEAIATRPPVDLRT